MSDSPDPRLTDLFVRYWDNALTPAEHDELATRLAGDPAARAEFQSLSVQVVTAAEVGALAPPAPTSHRLSRRTVLRLAGGGIAAGVVGTIFTRQYWFGEPDVPVHLSGLVGDVTIKASGREEAVATAGPVPPDAVLSTVGPCSSAVLRFADGSQVSLGGDAVASLGDRGRKLYLRRGTVTASLPIPAPGTDLLTVGTTEATCSRLGGAVLTLSRTVQATEVGVQSGRAAVSNAAGDPLEVVHPGEFLTVQADGRHRKRPVEPVSETCDWDLTRPLPDGWAVGHRDVPDGGPPAIVPVKWFDPYHSAEMYQIRSDHRWSQGFARLHAGSRFRVRYWVDRPGRGQLVAIVRRDDLASSDTGVIELNDAFTRARPGEWQWLDVKAGAMLDNKHAPKFRDPWVSFLIIFNTYKEDLGLRIAAFQVIPPGPVA